MTFSDFVNKWIFQMAHVSFGAWLTMLIAQHTTTGHAALWVLAFATVKEGIFDPLTKSGPTQNSEFQDWLFWLVGIIIGILSFL